MSRPRYDPWFLEIIEFQTTVCLGEVPFCAIPWVSSRSQTAGGSAVSTRSSASRMRYQLPKAQADWGKSPRGGGGGINHRRVVKASLGLLRIPGTLELPGQDLSRVTTCSLKKHPFGA